MKYLKSQDGYINSDFDMDGKRAPFDKVSKPININSSIKDLYFDYDGTITDLISGVNQINENIVELACYSGWFPKIYDLQTNFKFDIFVELPSEYFFVCNGETNSTDISTYHISGEDSDIVLFAAKSMEHISRKTDNFEVTAYFPPNMIFTVSKKTELLLRGYDSLTNIYGKRKSTHANKKYIYRPFGGWGYARNYIVIMPQIPDTNKKPSKFEVANSIFVDLHELAHAWWSSASTEKYDWINEAGAEFSALILMKELFDDEVYNARIGYYINTITNEQQAISIVNTASDSPDRELNHYMKTVLLYVGATRKFGFELFLKFLRDYSQNYIDSKNESTDNFLYMCKIELGKTAFDYFRKYLYMQGWHNIDVKKDILCE